jgi:PAS domain S-box-containing protein
VILFPIRSASRDWGVLAVCAPTAEQLMDEDKNVDMFAALICAALEREALLASLIGQQELLRIASQHRTITENIRDLLCLLDQEGDYLYASPSFEHMLGRAPAALVGRSLFDTMHPHDQEQARRQWAQISSGSGSEMLFRQRHADGSWRWLEATGAPVVRQGVQGVALVARDVTERRRLEAQLLQAQKMESMGRLAGGVAHDFNNLLTVIMGYADMARSNLDPSSEIRSDLGEIVKATTRAAALTRQLLTFARKQQIAPTLCNLNALLTDMTSLLLPLIGANVQLTRRLAPDLWSTRVDASQMEQVLINLAANARDAMPEGGRLTITTANMPAHSRPTVAEGGDQVLLSASDTGAGIAPEAIAQLFEPFFTTKEQGRGTGLGLAICYGIVRQHGGEIAVESTPGSGATFTISLPAVRERPAPRPPAAPDVRPHGNETILLAEDEAAVRALAARLLRAQGYSVLEAAHGGDALDVAARHPGPIDLLLTDVVMPQLGGPALAARLLAERPTLPVLYMSGYTDGEVSPGAALIQKPFAPAELMRAVRAALDNSSAPPSRGGSPR